MLNVRSVRHAIAAKAPHIEKAKRWTDCVYFVYACFEGQLGLTVICVALFVFTILPTIAGEE